MHDMHGEDAACGGRGEEKERGLTLALRRLRHKKTDVLEGRNDESLGYRVV